MTDRRAITDALSDAWPHLSPAQQTTATNVATCAAFHARLLRADSESPRLPADFAALLVRFGDELERETVARIRAMAGLVVEPEPTVLVPRGSL